MFKAVLLFWFGDLMGQGKKDALRVNFDKRLKLEFHGVKVTSDVSCVAEPNFKMLYGKFQVTSPITTIKKAIN